MNSKVYFYPGLGADSSLAPYHRLPGIEVQWIEWPKRFGGSWDEFILEIKKENRIEAGAVHAGMSFGGLVAQRMAGEFDGDAVILIGSFSSRKDIVWIFRCLLASAFLMPAAVFEIGMLPRFLVRHFFGIGKPEDLDLFYTMAGKLRGHQVKALIGYVGDALSEASKGSHGPEIKRERRVLRIHGSRDRILPLPNQAADVPIPGGGHLISLTHPAEINARMADWLARA